MRSTSLHMDMASKYSLLSMRWFILFALVLYALAHGFSNATADHGSYDMQWSPAKLLMQHINPYQWWLNGNIGQAIILHQKPNYLHTLYLFMLPLATLDWHDAKITWAIINSILGIFIVFFLANKAELSRKNQLIVLLLFLYSSSFQSAIASGQQALLTLFFLMAALYNKTNISVIINSSLAIMKYSFALPLLFYEYFKYGYKVIVGITAFTCMGILIFALLVHQNPIDIIFLPLSVSKNIGNGQADLMTLCNFFIAKPRFYITYIICFIYIWLSVYSYYRTNTRHWLMLDLAYLSLISLTSFKHLNYDFIFLLPLLICSFQFKTIHKIFVYTIIAWFWFGSKFAYDHIINAHHWWRMVPLQFILLVICAGMTKQYSKS